MDSIWTMFQLLFLGLLMIFQLLIFSLLVMFQRLSIGPSRVMSSYVVALLFLAAMAFSQEPCENDVNILISANNAYASEGKKFHLKVNATIFSYYTCQIVSNVQVQVSGGIRISRVFLFTQISYNVMFSKSQMSCNAGPTVYSKERF